MKFIVNQESVRDNVIAEIRKIDVKKPMVVRIESVKRSLPQNALWHKWLTIIADHCGYYMEDLKTEIKRKVFGMKELVSPLTGEITYRDYSSAEMNKEDFAKLMQATDIIAAQLGLILPTKDQI